MSLDRTNCENDIPTSRGNINLTICDKTIEIRMVIDGTKNIFVVCHPYWSANGDWRPHPLYSNR